MNATDLVPITEAAATACYQWIGRGNKIAADQAAVTAMRKAFAELPASGKLVIGEGEKDKAPQLYSGETFGKASANGNYDIAVDPLEGTTYLAKGLPNSFSVVGMCSAATMFDPGPSFYMEKLIVPAAAKNSIQPDMPIAEKLRVLAHALGKNIQDLTIYVLDRPRHNELVSAIYEAGARILLYSAGDLLGSILVALGDNRVDALMGTGGTPEGILSACVIKCLGGDVFLRVDPQSAYEQQRIQSAGIPTEWLSLDNIINSEEVYFSATAITCNGLWLQGIQPTSDGKAHLETCIMSSAHAARTVRREVTLPKT